MADDPIAEAIRRRKEQAEADRTRQAGEEETRQRLQVAFATAADELAAFIRSRLGTHAAKAGLELHAEGGRSAQSQTFRLGPLPDVQFRFIPQRVEVALPDGPVPGAAYFGQTGGSVNRVNGLNFLWSGGPDPAWRAVRFRITPGLREDAAIARELGLSRPDPTFLFGFEDAGLLQRHLSMASRGMHVVAIDTGSTLESAVDAVVLEAFS